MNEADEYSRTDPNPKLRDQAPATPALLVVGSADRLRPDLGQRLLRFKGRLTIGRRPPSDDEGAAAWVIRDDRLVSGRHAILEQSPDGFFDLEDLDSTNGLMVDGVPVEGKTRLTNGAVIFVGAHAAVFRLLTDEDAAAIERELASPFGPVASASPGMAGMCDRLRVLAQSGGEVLITGETGVGKEVYARAVHAASGRRGKFVAINCAALPRELVETELFGYERGAHSQARASKAGLIEEAEGGTLFLDEIGEMPEDVQAKLLRFVQDRMLVTVGGTRPRRVDARLLAATSRTAPPTAARGAGLRKDLGARLGAAPVQLPPLRDRIEDVGALAAHFQGAEPRPLDLATLQALCLYDWPGNVRELQKVIETAVLLARGADRIAAQHVPANIACIPERVWTGGTITTRGGGARTPTAPELEALLRKHNGNVARIARELGRKPFQIYRWTKRYRLKPEEYR